MFACVARSFSQVVLGLPLGLVPCRRTIVRSSVMPSFLTRWPWKVSRLLRSPSRRVGFVLALLNTSSLVTCSVHEMRSIFDSIIVQRLWSCSVLTLGRSMSLNRSSLSARSLIEQVFSSVGLVALCSSISCAGRHWLFWLWLFSS